MWKTHVGRKASQVSLFLYMILLVLSVFILIYNANTLYLNCFLTFGRGFFFQIFIYCYVSVTEYLFVTRQNMPFLPMAALILIYNGVQLQVGHQNERREAFKRAHMSC